jgi:hypothetical protein
MRVISAKINWYLLVQPAFKRYIKHKYCKCLWLKQLRLTKFVEHPTKKKKKRAYLISKIISFS